MINFIIIDDDKEIREIVESIINQTFKKDCQVFVKGFDKFDRAEIIEANNDCNAVFILDIELNDSYDGIEIASLIRREKCPTHEIIFLTGFVDYAFNVLNYKINPIAFIKKDNKFIEFLQKALKEAVDKINAYSEGQKIIIKKGNTDIELRMCDIIYAMKNKGTKSLSIITDLCNVETIETIDSFSNRIGEDFIRLDRSTIVNYKKIQSIDIKNKFIIMNNQETFYTDSKTIKKILERY